jgi:hypothetical protein
LCAGPHANTDKPVCPHANTDKPVAVALDGTVAVFFVNIRRNSPLLGANFIFQPSGRDRKEDKKE